jgi:hypothetical protein
VVVPVIVPAEGVGFTVTTAVELQPVAMK